MESCRQLHFYSWNYETFTRVYAYTKRDTSCAVVKYWRRSVGSSIGHTTRVGENRYFRLATSARYVRRFARIKNRIVWKKTRKFQVLKCVFFLYVYKNSWTLCKTYIYSARMHPDNEFNINKSINNLDCLFLWMLRYVKVYHRYFGSSKYGNIFRISFNIINICIILSYSNNTCLFHLNSTSLSNNNSFKIHICYSFSNLEKNALQFFLF